MTPKLPLIPLRDLVVLPGSVVPLFIGRDSSVAALDTAIEDDERLILMFTQMDAEVEEPTQSDIRDIGTIAEVLQVIKLADGTVKALFETRARVKLEALERGKYLAAEFSDFKEVASEESGKKFFSELASKFARWAKFVEMPLFYLGRFTPEMNLSWATDRIATNLRLSNEDKANCLSEASVDKRIQLLIQLIDDLISKNLKELSEFESYWRDQPELSEMAPTPEFTKQMETIADLFPEVFGSALKSSASPENLKTLASDLTYNKLTNGDNWLYITHGLADHAGFETAVITRELQDYPVVFLNYIAQDAILRKFRLLEHISDEEYGCAVLSIELPGEGHRYFLLTKVEQSETPTLLAIAITESEADMHDLSELKAQLLSSLGGPFSSLDRESVS